MSTRILGIALVALATVVPPTHAVAQNNEAADVVQRFIRYRTELTLSDSQVAQLTKLETGFRQERGRLVMVGRDRVPGKSVPRYTRRYTTPEQAFRRALALVPQPHRDHAQVLIMGAATTPTQ